MTTPTHEYETVKGTKPGAHVAHEPRTIKHVTNNDLFMMTEIGDGTFVQWSNCRKCSARVGDCKCAGGPTPPEYMERWRAARFEKDLNKRPDPEYALIPSLITWLEERGYEVTKSVAKQLEEAKPFDPATDVGIVDLTDEEAEAFDAALREDSLDVTEKVDEGLDAALEKVRETRKSSAFDERPEGNVYKLPDDTEFPDF